MSEGFSVPECGAVAAYQELTSCSKIAIACSHDRFEGLHAVGLVPYEYKSRGRLTSNLWSACSSLRNFGCEGTAVGGGFGLHLGKPRSGQHSS
jgi:hypothetical protein